MSKDKMCCPDCGCSSWSETNPGGLAGHACFKCKDCQKWNTRSRWEWAYTGRLEDRITSLTAEVARLKRIESHLKRVNGEDKRRWVEAEGRIAAAVEEIKSTDSWFKALDHALTYNSKDALPVSRRKLDRHIHQALLILEGKAPENG